MATTHTKTQSVELLGQTAFINRSRQEILSELSDAENEMVRLLVQACQPLFYVHLFQNSHYGLDLWQDLMTVHSLLRKHPSCAPEEFHRDFEAYLSSFWANNGPYNLREFENHKLVPTFSKTLFSHLLRDVGVMERTEWMFNPDVDPNRCVPGHPETSGTGLYPQDLRAEEVEGMPKPKLNEHVVRDECGNLVTLPFTAKHPILGTYLRRSCDALQRAYLLGEIHSEHFDSHFLQALHEMICFLDFGDMDNFDAYSKEWVQSSSRLDFNFGFIEVYHDPLEHIGEVCGEVSFRPRDLTKWIPLLEDFEDRLPYPPSQARPKEGRSPFRADIHVQLYASGANGPLCSIAAYCLPNDDEIRSAFGSKQVIFASEKPLSDFLCPDRCRLYMHSSSRRVHEISPRIADLLWDVGVLLHETVGHGAGALEEGLTSEIVANRFEGQYGTLEELRAEVNALYLSLLGFADLCRLGAYEDFPERLSEEGMSFPELIICHQANSALKRLTRLAPGATEIKGAHSRADCIIANFLAYNGFIRLTREKVEDPEVGEERDGIDVYAYAFVCVPGIEMGHLLHTLEGFVSRIQDCRARGDKVLLDEILGFVSKNCLTLEVAHEIAASRRIMRERLMQGVKQTASVFSHLSDTADELCPSSSWRDHV